MSPVFRCANVKLTKLILVRDDIKSYGEFAIFIYLKTEAWRESKANYGKKLHLKIKTVEDIDVKMT